VIVIYPFDNIDSLVDILITRERLDKVIRMNERVDCLEGK